MPFGSARCWIIDAETMGRRFIYGSGVVLLLILLSLVVWQASFNLGDLAKPVDLTQTVLFWAVSTLVFVLTIALGFILFRTGVRLYVEPGGLAHPVEVVLRCAGAELHARLFPVFL